MDSHELFQRRIALATPKELIVGAFIHGTITSLSEEFSLAVAEAVLKEWPQPKDLMLFNKYPATDWLRLIDLAASTAARQQKPSYAQAMEKIGRGSVRHVHHTSLGKIFSAMMGNDPHKVLSISLMSARSLSTWGERTYEKLGPNSARVRLRQELLGPPWILGFWSEVFLLTIGLTTVSMAVEDYQEPGLDFAIRYTW